MMSAVGDAVHVLPVINALKRHAPACHITWVLQPGPASLVRGHRSVDEILIFDRSAGMRAFAAIRRELASRAFDLVINLQVYFKAGIVTAFARAPVKLGFDRARARDLNWLFTTHRIPARTVGQHVQDQYFEFLEHLGVEPRPVAWQIPISAEERAAQRAWFERLERPACAAVVGTSRPRKNWAPERWARLLEHVYREHGLQPVLVGGPSAVERELADAVMAEARVPLLDALGDDVRRLVWLLDGSALVVSPDTGPLHLARALDRPVVGLFGYTNPKRYGPYGRPENVVDGYARFPGEPYEASMEHRPEGMDRVTVAAAIEVVGRVLRRTS